jgi:hypothetical protein
LAVGIRRCFRQSETGRIRSGLGQPSDRTDRDGCSKDLQIVMIDFVFEARFSDLIQALKLVKVNGVSVRHDEAMEDHSQARLSHAEEIPGDWCCKTVIRCK